MKTEILASILIAIISNTLCATLEPSSELSMEDTIISLERRMSAMEELFPSSKAEERDFESGTRYNELSVTLQELQRRFLEYVGNSEKRLSGLETALADLSDRFESEVKENLTQTPVTAHEASQRDVEKVIQKSITSTAENLSLQINENLSVFESMESNFTNRMRNLENSILKLGTDCANASHVAKIDESLQNLDKMTKDGLQSLQAELQPLKNQLEQRSDQDPDVTETHRNQGNPTSEIFALNRQLLDIQKSCSDPPSIENGHAVYGGEGLSGRKDGAVVTYACQGTTTLVGSGEMTCRFGEWTGTLPKCVNNTCSGEPPSLRNGKPVEFEREHGSIVLYECDRNFVMTGNSTVRCMFGEWEGHLPLCSYFDPTFYLETDRSFAFYVDCSSDENSDKIEFSRVLDNGLGLCLPRGTTKRDSRNSAGIGFSTVPDYLEKYGAFQCEFDGEGRRMNIILPIQMFVGTYFVDRTEVVNIGDSFVLQPVIRGLFPIHWKHNGSIVPSWYNQTRVEIQTVQHTDAGFYECLYGSPHPSNSGLLRLIVRRCRADLYGEHCDQQCPPCYNGGICHDLLGICVCPVGFEGYDCGDACPENYYGPYCLKKCDKEHCKYHYRCKPDPYGCSCARGWQGHSCHEACSEGWYGASCKQPCHCASGPSSCNRFTGVCTGGCAPGWTGVSCQIEVAG